MTPIEIAVLDMAGTTVADDGAVEAAFVAAVGSVGVGVGDERLPAMLQYVRATMGQSKIAVFRHLLDGEESLARQANSAFEAAYRAHVAGCRPVEGAVAAMAALRAAGVRIALTTGFSPATQQVLLDALGWHGLVDCALAPPADGRGRPLPDLPLAALLRLRGTDVRSLAVVGDTASDVHSGVRAGAGLVVGVLTGAHGADDLRAAGATHVVASVADVPALLAG